MSHVQKYQDLKNGHQEIDSDERKSDVNIAIIPSDQPDGHDVDYVTRKTH